MSRMIGMAITLPKNPSHKSSHFEGVSERLTRLNTCNFVGHTCNFAPNRLANSECLLTRANACKSDNLRQLENEEGDPFGSPSVLPRTGFEPARLAALPPQSSASANSATWAAWAGF